MADQEGKKSRRTGGGKYPAKTSINLLIEEKHTEQNVRALLLFAGFMVVLGVFVKWMVIDKINEINSLEAEYQQQEDALAKLQEANSIYEKVRSEYSHYGNSYLNDEEAALQDRLDILKVVEQELLEQDALGQIQVSENVASLTINSDKLRSVAQIVAKLEEQPIVEYVTVSTAQTNDATASLAAAAQRSEEAASQAASSQSQSEGTDDGVVTDGGQDAGEGQTESASQPQSENQSESGAQSESEVRSESETQETQAVPAKKVVTTMMIYFKSAALEETEGLAQTEVGSAADTPETEAQ